MSALTALIAALASGAVSGLLMVRAARQCRRPSDRAGRQVLLRMNASHAAVTHWGLGHSPIEENFTILDVGCGGGRTIDLLTSRTRSNVYGVDYSEVSVDTARKMNERAIAEGRVDIQHASVSQLPFPDTMFDMAIAVETHYYWPDLPRDVREVMRVLKHGGRFLIIAETYRGRRNDWLYRPTMTLVLRAAYLTPDEHRQLLLDAGYANVQVFEERSRGWICAIGTRT
jgi:SAM-dependent methyltransferase